MHACMHTYIHTYIFVAVNFDALAQASDFRIERRQDFFLCWMQDSNPEGIWNPIFSRLNACWQTHTKTFTHTSIKSRSWPLGTFYLFDTKIKSISMCLYISTSTTTIEIARTKIFYKRKYLGFWFQHCYTLRHSYPDSTTQYAKRNWLRSLAADNKTKN